MTLPLANTRILDLTRLFPGALCTLILADLGAEVLKVEPPEGDYWRDLAPYSFRALNRNKWAITLDLKTPAGVEKLLRLVHTADVLVESFRPGVLDRLGLSVEKLREANPRLIVASLSGYGSDGPRAQEAGHDLNYMGLAGLLDGIESPPTAQAADLLGGFAAASAILAALLRRERNGQGAVVNVALLDAALVAGIMARAEASAQDAVPDLSRGILSGGLACYHLYRTADGQQMALGALEARFFAAFCEVVGRPDLIAHQYDPTRQDWLRGELAAIFQTRTCDEWVAFLARSGADTCCTPVLNLRESAADAGVQARGLVFTDSDGLAHTRSPVRLADADPPPFAPAPGIGQDNDLLG